MAMDKSTTLSSAKQALLEQRLKGCARAPVSGGPEIPKRPEHDAAPLSFAQRQMWVIDQMTPRASGLQPADRLPPARRPRRDRPRAGLQ